MVAARYGMHFVTLGADARCKNLCARYREMWEENRGDPHRDQVFHPLPTGLMNLHRRLKQAFDPHGIFNPGRMYREL